MLTTASLGHRTCRSIHIFTKIARTLCLICLVTGCQTPFYRQQADDDTNCLVDQKSAAVGVAPGQYRIDVDPRSRMFDPHDPDCEPMPPDDPTSNRIMHCVDCKKGSKCWRCLPKTPFVENPGWLEHLPYNEKGEVELDLSGAVELALVESPRYQSQLEELYLSALDVTFERFRFDTLFFGGSSVFFTADGRDRSGTGESSSLLEVAPSSPINRFRVNKLTASGGTLVAGLANSLVWQFAGPDDYSGNTLLDFSLVQPLLRAGGRTRVLERLTISERSLLANVRQMERFRRGLYLSVVTGGDPGNGPSRRGGFFGGSGLEGFSGVGGGGFGRVGAGNNNGFGFGFGNNTGGAGAQGAGGYLGLLQTSQVLRNQRANVLALRDSVEQLQASNEAGRIDRFQVDLARQALYNAQSRLLTSETTYQGTVDNFKVDIGLPPELETKINDPFLDRFNLLDPAIEELKQQVADGLNALRQLRAELADEELAESNLRGKFEVLRATVRRMGASVEDRIAAVESDFAKLEAALPERGKHLEQLAERAEVREANIDPLLFSPELFRKRATKRREEMQSLQRLLTKSLRQLDEAARGGTANDVDPLNKLVGVLTKLSGQLLELSLVQASVRLETINFAPVEISPEQALAIASAHRRDWKNARASLVDAWRLIYFNANDLKSGLDLVFSGDLGNVGDNPLDLRGSNGRLRVGLEFDAPLTRLAERNVYRQSLIEYQQARRNYYQFRDRIYQGLRNTLRQIRLNEVNFELRRAAVQVAISQVDLTQLRLSEPPKPGETSEFGNTTARDLVQSLSDLLNVQNDFLSVWVNYEVQRLNLEFNLGVMELTPQGLRIENDMPLETYLVDLPINSADMGISAEGCKVVYPEESLPGGDSPELILPGDGSNVPEPLPAPVSLRGVAIPWPVDEPAEVTLQSQPGVRRVVWTIPPEKKLTMPAVPPILEPTSGASFPTDDLN